MRSRWCAGTQFPQVEGGAVRVGMSTMHEDAREGKIRQSKENVHDLTSPKDLQKMSQRLSLLHFLLQIFVDVRTVSGCKNVCLQEERIMTTQFPYVERSRPWKLGEILGQRLRSRFLTSTAPENYPCC